MIPSKNVALINVKSHLGQLWQNYQICNETQVIYTRNYDNLSETLETGESFLQAALRGLREELQLHIPRHRLEFKRYWGKRALSASQQCLMDFNFGEYDLTLSKLEAINTPLIVKEKNFTVFLEWRK